MTIGEILLSVIVPIYNTSEYLERCIQSLVSQTLKNIEIILIDDGSTDNSLELCKEYEKRYFNVKVYSKTNSGLGKTRNVGMKLSKGEYIAFVDSDDFISCNMYEYMTKLLIEYGADVAICDYEKVYREEESNLFEKNVRNTQVQVLNDKYDIIKEYLLFKIEPFAWNKVFKKNFLIDNKLKYEEDCYYEDLNMTLEALFLARKICSTNRKFYGYFQRESSITHKLTEKHLIDYINRIDKFYMFINTNYDVSKLEIELRDSKFRLSYNLLNLLVNSKKQFLLKKSFEEFPKKMVIFGASEAGKLANHYFKIFDIEIIYFCDNNQKKWGNNLKELK